MSWNWNWNLLVGLQSANWAPSAMLVVALESGVYICKVHEDCHVIEFDSGSKDPDNPFYHVLWNEHGDAVLCAKLTGCVQLCDLKATIIQPSNPVFLWAT